MGVDFSPRRSAWRVRVGGNWTGPYSPFDEPGVVMAGYGIANAGLMWRLHRAEIDLGVRNAFNRAYPELVAGGVVSPGEPRAGYVTVHVYGSMGGM
jgi:outer membrane receptor for ferric coprogen and ferric-rhodotorulic acid